MIRHSSYFCAVVLASFLLSCHPADEPIANPPNIVFILIDDLGWADLSCYGNTFNETPHIDRLAAEGTRYSDAYAAAPVCSPARAALMSGIYPARLGLTDFIPGHWRPYEKLTVPRNDPQYLDSSYYTFAEAFSDNGYSTGYFGKWHLGWEPHQMPNAQGFDTALVSSGWGHFFPPVKTQPTLPVDSGTYLTDFLTERTLDFIRDHQAERFMVVLSHFAVHIPLEAKESTVQKYQHKPIVENYPCNPVYAAMLEHIDDGVGRIMNLLQSLELEENTLVVFYSDNGGLVQRFDKADSVIVSTNAPLRDEKGTLYEGGIRVPLIMRWPSYQITQGKTSGHLINGVDIYPTLLDACEITLAKEALDGHSFLSSLRDEPDLDTILFWHYPHYHHSTPASAMRSGKYKLIHDLELDQSYLYDLIQDIGETTDLKDELPEIHTRLVNQLNQWRLDVQAAMPTPNAGFNEEQRYFWGKYEPPTK